MDDLLMRSRLQMPVTTGTAKAQQKQAPKTSRTDQPSPFRQMLEEKLSQSSSLSFSKHAVARARERNLNLDAESLERLDEGVRIAREKGMGDTLILVDTMAFIVNVKNATVITTLGGNDLKGNAITNIDGTVIV